MRNIIKNGLIFLCLVLGGTASSQTVLETLWKTGCEMHYGLRSAALDVRQAEQNLRYKGCMYPVSVETSVTSQFNDMYEETAWYASDAVADIGVRKQLPGSLSVRAGIDYGITKGLPDPYGQCTEDNVGYSHSPSASLTVSQGLLPYWLQGVRKDPNVMLLKDELEQKRLSREAQEKNVMHDITAQFIQLRQNGRLARLTEQKLAFYDLNVQAYQENLAAGNGSASDVWNADEERWRCRQTLADYQRNFQSAWETLSLYCGGNLPEDFMGVLPDSDAVLCSADLTGRIVRSRLSQLQNTYVLERQQGAPVLSVKGSLSEQTDIKEDFAVNYGDDKDYCSWAVTVALDFSNVSFRRNRLQKDAYLARRSQYEMQLEEIARQRQKDSRLYDRMIALYEGRVEQAQSVCRNREQYMAAMRQELETGNCSRLDMLSAEHECAAAECSLANDRDMLWYYQWLRTQNI